MKRKLHFFAIAIIGGILSTTQAYALFPKISLSALFGPDLSTLFGTGLTFGGNGVNPSANSFGYGLRGDIQMTSHFDVGCALQFLSLDPLVVNTSLSSTGVTMTQTYLLGELNYHFSEDLSPLYVGVRAGLGMTVVSAPSGINPTATSAGVSSTGPAVSLALGTVVGYDFTFNSHYRVGPRVSYLVNLPSPVLRATVGDLQLHAMVGYVF